MLPYFFLNLLIFLLVLLFFPIWLCLFLLRPSWHQFFIERLKCTSQKPFEMWFHGASVGEIQAIELLVHQWYEKNKTPLLITCNTVTGREVAQKKFPFAHVQLAPLDFFPVLSWWMKSLTVKAHVLSELDIWPLRQAKLKSKKIPTLVLGARLSEKGLRRTRNAWFFLKEAYLSVERWGCRDSDVRDRLLSLGIEESKCEATGSLKYDSLVHESDQRIDVGQRIFRDPVIVAGSLHPGEEEPFLALARDYQVIVVPRHPQAFTYFQKSFQDHGIEATLWSSGKSLGKTGVLLVDEMGLLRDIYQLASVAFIGGSLVPVGGHNVLEPAQHAVGVVVGPHTHHFSEELQILLKNGGALQRKSADEIREELLRILRDSAKALQLGQKARESLNQLTGGTEKSFKMLESICSNR